MRQCVPHQICATRSFLELLCRTAPALAGLLQYHGAVLDSRSPPLRYYRLDPQAQALSDSVLGAPPEATAAASTSRDATDVKAPAVHPRSHAGAESHPGSWRSYAVVMLLAAGATLTWLYFARGELHAPEPAKQPPAVAPARSLPEVESRITPAAPHATLRPLHAPRDTGANPAKVPTRAVPVRAASGSEVRSAARRVDTSPPTNEVRATKSYEPRNPRPLAATYPPTTTEFDPQARPSGTLQLAIKPWGQVYVDGAQVGLTPPLRIVQLHPGRRQITIMNGALPMYQRTVTVKPDATIRLTHDFGCPSTWDNCQARLGRDSSYARE
jgi:hypothetical protein